jgi:hypothetical protein
MRYQQKKYTFHNCERNKDILNVNMSSDNCIFVSPKYNLSGGTKIPCNDVTCDLSGVTLSNAVTGITTCVSSPSFSSATFDNVIWETVVSHNSDVVYSGTFYTGGNDSDVPTSTPFYNSVETAFTSLGYNFSRCDSKFTITRPYGVDTLDVDIYVSANFNAPFTGTCSTEITSACTEVFNQIDSGSTGVHIVTSAQTDIDLTVNFTANTEYITSDLTTRAEIYKYSPASSVFVTPAVYKSSELTYSDIIGTSGFTLSVPISDLNIDGDYLLKTYHKFNACTNFLNELGEVIDTALYATGSKFGLYQEECDYFFVVCSSAATPTLVQGTTATGNPAGALTQQVFFPVSGQTTFPLSTTLVGSVVVTLNGVTLSNTYDYIQTPNSIILSGETVESDIVSLIYTSTGSAPLTSKVINVSTAIVSGATGGQGSEDIYYNTGTSKYEVYVDVTPSAGNDIIVEINGVTLSKGIDFYQSSSDPKRIILEGDIMVGDIVLISYIAASSVATSVTTPNPLVSWTIDPAPQAVNGVFYVESSTASTFTDISSSAVTPYIVGQTNYSANITVSGSVGTQIYYRVRNVKDYVSIKGDIIRSIATSDIVPLTIASNAINTY